MKSPKHEDSDAVQSLSAPCCGDARQAIQFKFTLESEQEYAGFAFTVGHTSVDSFLWFHRFDLCTAFCLAADAAQTRYSHNVQINLIKVKWKRGVGGLVAFNGAGYLWYSSFTGNSEDFACQRRAAPVFSRKTVGFVFFPPKTACFLTRKLEGLKNIYPKKGRFETNACVINAWNSYLMRRIFVNWVFMARMLCGLQGSKPMIIYTPSKKHQWRLRLV